ncbi:MAG: DUF4398 domain-containing protein [Acidobacteria bacterium]|nr:DUF4398 domain-containing protein [Acidobacteriota bacterium]
MKIKTTGRWVLLFAITLFFANGQLLAQTASDVQFRAVAVNFPLGEKVELKMRGTTRYAQTKGTVEVEHKGGYTKVLLDIKDLDAPSEKQYATYVVWAVTPEGLADNLGEFRPRKTRIPWPVKILPGPWGGPMETTTRFRTFSIVITAEPHFLVSSPSRQVVATNLPPEGKYTGLEVEAVAVNFRGDIGMESVPWREEHVTLAKDLAMPIELLQARRAMDIARFLQVEKYAEAEFKAAEETLSQAEKAYEQEQPDRAALLARQAIQRFELARQLNQERLEAQLKRQKELELADVVHQLEGAEKEAATAKANFKETTVELDEKNRQLQQARVTADDVSARVQRLEAQLEEALRAAHRAQQQMTQAEERAAEAESRAAAAEQQLRQMQASSMTVQEHRFRLRLAQIAEVRSDDQAMAVGLPVKDLFEETSSDQMAALSTSGKQKLAAIGEALLSYPDAVCSINVYLGGRADAQSLQHRAENYITTVAAYLLSKGVPGDRLKPGETAGTRSRTVADQERVELVFFNR